MRNAKEILDHQFLEMRWRCLSLAADFDRVHGASDGSTVLNQDPRLKQLRQAIDVLLDSKTSAPNRAERVQMIFSDMTPPPSKQ
jgi:hypothetical protein